MLKKFLVVAGIGILGIAVGFWAGTWHTNKSREENFTFNEYLNVNHHVKVLNHIYNNDSEKAINELERRLNVEILVLGPNPYHPRPLNEHQLNALRLAAAHRSKHPFFEKSPGVNKMVQAALQAAN